MNKTHFHQTVLQVLVLCIAKCIIIYYDEFFSHCIVVLYYINLNVNFITRVYGTVTCIYAT